MFILPPLPYPYSALDPILSDDTLRVHHDRHHKAYVDKTNDLARAAGLDGKSLEDVVREASKTGNRPLFNNAAQAWNHAFFWASMSPDRQAPPAELKTAIDRDFGDQAGLKTALAPGGKSCSGRLKAALEDAFGSVGDFEDRFITEGVAHFGSGWVWLVTGSEGLKVISTHDADDTLVKDGLFPLLVCDLWEHAYYLDYQNERPEYLKAWLDKAANYAFAEQQWLAAQDQGQDQGQDAGKAKLAFRYPQAGEDLGGSTGVSGDPSHHL